MGFIGKPSWPPGLTNQSAIVMKPTGFLIISHLPPGIPYIDYRYSKASFKTSHGLFPVVSIKLIDLIP